MVESDEEIAQGVQMNLSIRKDEFEFDEFIGLDSSFLQNKLFTDEDVADAVLSALQVMTDQNILEGADEIDFTREGDKGRVSLVAIKTDGTEINLEGADVNGP